VAVEARPVECCCLNLGCDFLTQHTTSSTSKQTGASQQITDHTVPESIPLTGTHPEDMDCSPKFRWKWLLDILMGSSGKITVIYNHRRASTWRSYAGENQPSNFRFFWFYIAKHNNQLQVLCFWILSIVLSLSKNPSCLFFLNTRFGDWILSPKRVFKKKINRTVFR
jgi:hypothetical protein